MYPAHDMPQKLCNTRGGWGITISSNPDYHPIMQADPCVSSNAPSLGSSGEPDHPLYDIVFSWGGTPVHEGYTGPGAGIGPYANRMGKHHENTMKEKFHKFERVRGGGVWGYTGSTMLSFSRKLTALNGVNALQDSPLCLDFSVSVGEWKGI